MKLYSKPEVVDYIWQYSRFYGNKLGECERYFEDGEGYVALILLFEVTENICKSIHGDYNRNFNSVIKQLKDTGKLTEKEAGFLSTNEYSVRKIRNLFAHENLMGINIVEEENGKDIYYPLTEDESCRLLYDKISNLLFNILLKIVSNSFIVEINVNLEDYLDEFRTRIEILSARKMLELLGYSHEDIKIIEGDMNESTLRRLADNSTNVNVLAEIFKNLK